MKWDELETPHSHKSCKREVFNPVVSELKKNWLDIFASQNVSCFKWFLHDSAATRKMTCYLHEHLLYLTAGLKTNVKRCPRHPNTSWEDIWTPKNLPKTSYQEVLGCLGPRVGSRKSYHVSKLSNQVLMFLVWGLSDWCWNLGKICWMERLESL